MKNKKVSILMPVKNGEKYLEEAIKSVLGQTFTDFELIIINNYSTDNTLNILEDIAKQDDRIVVVSNKGAGGIYGALNTGLDISTGAFIARADADDINRPYRLAIQIEFLAQHKDIDIVGGGYQLFGAGSSRKIFHPKSSVVLAWKYVTNTYFCHPSVMFRRSVLKTIPYYPEVVCEDFAFFSKILHKHKGANIRKILVDYRQHESNYSNTQSENIKISIKNTFIQNFEFYTNSLENSEVFYNFHFRKELKIRNILKIIKISIKISQKILRQYDIKNYSFQAFYLYFTIKKDILVSLVYPHIKNTYGVLQKK